MITLYLICKLTGFLIKITLWLLLLPFQIILLPFKLIFGKPQRSTAQSNDGFWEGLLIGSLFF